MTKMLFTIAGALLAAGVLPTASAAPTTVTVDCNRGQTIATALLQGDYRKPLIVNVRGTCNKSVLIDRDNVTLRGDPNATINATNANTDVITVEGNGTRLENLTLSGGYYGVRNNQVFRLMVANCVIQDTTSDGIRSFAGDTRVSGTTVQRAGGNGVYLTRGSTLGASSNSQFRNNANAGIYGFGNSTVAVSGSTISGNVTGVLLGNGSEGTFSDNTISGNSGVGITLASSQASIGAGNVISNNAIWGVWVYSGSLATIYGNTISDNGADGVNGYLGTTLVMNENQVTGNAGFGIACTMNCTMELNTHTLENNAAGGIFVAQGTKLMLIGTIHSTGSGWGLQCDDKESSVGGLGFLDGTVSETCTDFNN